MSEEKEELPEGWCRTTIGEIIHFINGFCFKSSDYPTREQVLVLSE